MFFWIGEDVERPSTVREKIRDFFRVSSQQNHVFWGRLNPWKWVPGISPGVKAAGAYGWRPTTLVVPKVKIIRGLNLPGNPRATSACRGTPLLFICYDMTFKGTILGAKNRYFSLFHVIKNLRSLHLPEGRCSSSLHLDLPLGSCDV